MSSAAVAVPVSASSQYPAVKSASGTSVNGVGCGRAHREVRQWGSKPEQMQDRRRGWLPKVALFEAASSLQYQQSVVFVSEYLIKRKDGGAERHQDRPGGSPGPGYRRTSIVRWSPVKQPRSPRPRQRLGRVCGNRGPVQCQGRQMV